MKNKILAVLSTVLISTSSFAGMFDSMVGELNKAASKSVSQEKVQESHNEKDKQIKAESKKAKVLDGDKLRVYFNNIPIKVPSVKKTDIAFAGIGENFEFHAMIEKICEVKSFKIINGVSKEDYCAKDSKYKRATEPVPKDFFDRKSWSTLYTRDILGSDIVEGKKVHITSIQAQTITASPLILKGVDFTVDFIYSADRNQKVIKGMLIDGTVPMVYYRLKNNRFITAAVLDKIKLKPINTEAYNTQSEALIKVFAKKYPKLNLTNTMNNGVKDYDYKSNTGSFTMTFSPRRSKHNYITYSFGNRKYGVEYIKIYEDKVKEELNAKGDDSDNI